MDPKLRRISESATKSCAQMMGEGSRNFNPGQPFMQCNPTNLCYGGKPEQTFPEFPLALDTETQSLYQPEHEVKSTSQFKPSPNNVNNAILDWDPRLVLSNLSFLEQKIHQVQDIVRSMINQEGQLISNRANEMVAQRHLVTADLTSIIIQLISTAGSLLPSMKNTLVSTNPSVGRLGSVVGARTSFGINGSQQQDEVMRMEVPKALANDELIESFNSHGNEGGELIKGLNGHGIEGDELIKCLKSCEGEGTESVPVEEHDVKDYDDGVDGENLPPGSYEVLQLEKEEILAPHTHFCTICGKGFKRDANLRMHMRGHGDEYKTPAALAKPHKEASSEPALIKRYSCPFVGCKRNKEHKKFQPLKTILCVKNHYKRSHCDKSFICSRCNTKKFSVIADLKTHEKHCGRDKWLCSCGTTFSRKDKLFGHVALFQGHTPVLAVDEAKVSGISDHVRGNEVMNGMVGSMDYNFAGSTLDDVQILNIKGVDDGLGCFSPMNFDACNFGGLDDFPRAAFEVSESSFSFLPSGSSNFIQRGGDN